jgi:hypothetical protein
LWIKVAEQGAGENTQYEASRRESPDGSEKSVDVAVAHNVELAKSGYAKW